MRPFRGRFFRPRGIAEEGRISGFWGDLRGAFGLVRPHARARTSREFVPFLAFPLFRHSRYSVATTRKTPRRHLLRLTASCVIRLPRAMMSRDGGAQKRDGSRRRSVRGACVISRKELDNTLFWEYIYPAMQNRVSRMACLGPTEWGFRRLFFGLA